jgi:hypothetical protein
VVSFNCRQESVLVVATQETAGLREALAELGIEEGRILSFDGKESVDEFSQTPVWQWLLES